MPGVSQLDPQVIQRRASAMMANMSRISAIDGHGDAPRFDVVVPGSGYRWWYIDGISDDGANGIVVIAFIGSVFSPYYFRARAGGIADPLNHCAINVGLYRRRGKLWAMTERGRKSVEQSAESFRVGPSGLSWHGDRLEIDIRERATPFAQRVVGKIVLRPEMINECAYGLDAGNRHAWQPVAPAAQIEVRLEKPALSWRGHGYFDTNSGDRPLEDDFLRWNWSRGRRRGDTSITYAVTQNDGRERALALRFGPHGDIEELPVPPSVTLPMSGWRVGRDARADVAPRVRRTLEDTPFYTRSLLTVDDNVSGPALLMHESLALDRFKTQWVQMLLPFRMPRVA
jgi:carotenoid 1,2-hydratase